MRRIHHHPVCVGAQLCFLRQRPERQKRPEPDPRPDVLLRDTLRERLHIAEFLIAAVKRPPDVIVRLCGAVDLPAVVDHERRPVFYPVRHLCQIVRLPQDAFVADAAVRPIPVVYPEYRRFGQDRFFA